MRKKTEIVLFFADAGDDASHLILSYEDWDLLSSAHSFLQPFDGATLSAESDESSIGHSLEMMDILLRHYEQQKVCFKAKLGIFINKLLGKIQLASFSKRLNASCY